MSNIEKSVKCPGCNEMIYLDMLASLGRCDNCGTPEQAFELEVVPLFDTQVDDIDGWE